MAWIQPELAWTAEDIPSPSDFNRIEGNEDYLKTALDLEVVNRGLAVTAEGVARASADSTLQTNINNEAAARIAGDAAERMYADSRDTIWANDIGAKLVTETESRSDYDAALVSGAISVGFAKGILQQANTGGFPTPSAAIVGQFYLYNVVAPTPGGGMYICLASGVGTYAWYKITVS
jgi:hypothetical protein